MRLILVGFGTVGRGVAESLVDAATELQALGLEARIVAVVDPIVGSVCDPAGLDPSRMLELVDAGRSLTEYDGVEPVPLMPETLGVIDADVLVEATPTNLTDGEPGLSHIRAALQAGLDVATTNKGPVALAYNELDALAAANGAALRLEGTVLSGTPVLNLCEFGLAAAGIRAVRGIVNGTCNYILSEMETGRSYDEALAAAQEKGYAEADPTGDVEGWDAAAKALILANRVLGADLELADVVRKGISDLSAGEVAGARREGTAWRLVASVERRGDRCTASVEPRELDGDDPLAAVTGAGNLLVFETEALGPVSIAGPGAGRRATGHAVVADLVAIHRRRVAGAEG